MGLIRQDSQAIDENGRKIETFSNLEVSAQIDGNGPWTGTVILKFQVQVTEVGKTAGFFRHSPGPQAHRYCQVPQILLVRITHTHVHTHT